MKCPKCETGIIKKMQFRSTGVTGWACDMCQTFWFDDETITDVSGHALSSYAGKNDMEYDMAEINEKDQDHEIVPTEEEKYRKVV